MKHIIIILSTLLFTFLFMAVSVMATGEVPAPAETTTLFLVVIDFIKSYGPELLNQLFYFLGGVTTIATIMVRFTKTKRDDEIVDSWRTGLYYVISMLPTIGVNPRTKDLVRTLKHQEDGYKKPPNLDRG